MQSSVNLTAVFRSLPGIYVALSPDPEFIMLAVSDRRLEATMTRREDVTGKPLFDVFPASPAQNAAGASLLRESLTRILTTGESETLAIMRYDMPTENGGFVRRFWKPTNTVVRNMGGEIAFILHHVEDVTAQYLAEESLRHSDVRYRQILDSAKHYAIMSFDLLGRITSWNSGATNILGWTEDEMLGHTAERFFTEEDKLAGRPAEELAQALSQGFAEDERWHQKKDGTTFWASGEMRPLLDEAGQAMGFVKILRDRTEHERMNAERTAALQRLQQLTETLQSRVAEEAAHRDRIWHLSPDLMDVCDVNGRLLSVNEAWTAMLGWPEAVLLRTNFLDLVHADDRAPTIAELHRLDSGKPSRRFENRFRTQDGAYRTISWVAAPFEGRYYAIGRDITGQREVEDQLRQSQKMEAIGHLTGGIAHDFNNLLATIMSSLELLNRKIRPLDGGDSLGRYTSMATAASQRAASLVQRLLAFSRKQSLDLVPVDVNRSVLDMEEMLRRTLGEKVKLTLSLDTGLCSALTDRNQLENAMLNLCINARDAMPDGGVLQIHTSMTELDRSYVALHPHLQPGSYLRLGVSDTGTGMPPEVVAKAFDPFFTTKPIGQGTGLGLSMIYGFLRQTHGHVSIHSVEGQGTTVNMYLSCGTAFETPQEAPVAVAQLPSGGGETVLFVEDEPGVRSIISEVLSELHYSIHEASDADSALKTLDRIKTLDLLITDVGLPGMNGRQLAEVVRATHPDLKILFITGYVGHASVRSEFLDQGMDMLAKPFTIDALARKVQEMLS